MQACIRPRLVTASAGPIDLWKEIHILSWANSRALFDNATSKNFLLCCVHFHFLSISDTSISIPHMQHSVNLFLTPSHWPYRFVFKMHQMIDPAPRVLQLHSPTHTLAEHIILWHPPVSALWDNYPFARPWAWELTPHQGQRVVCSAEVWFIGMYMVDRISSGKK